MLAKYIVETNRGKPKQKSVARDEHQRSRNHRYFFSQQNSFQKNSPYLKRRIVFYKTQQVLTSIFIKLCICVATLVRTRKRFLLKNTTFTKSLRLLLVGRRSNGDHNNKAILRCRHRSKNFNE